jgi:hypothetical protein
MSKKLINIDVEENINFEGTANKIIIPDNQTAALEISGSDSQNYITFNSTNSSEQITISQPLRYTGSTPTDGYILQTNAQGDLSYVANSGGASFDQINTLSTLGTQDTIYIMGAILDMLFASSGNLNIDSSSNGFTPVFVGTQNTLVSDGSITLNTVLNTPAGAQQANIDTVIPTIRTNTISTFTFWVRYPSGSSSGSVDSFVHIYTTGGDEIYGPATHFLVKYTHDTTRLEIIIENELSLSVKAFVFLDITDGNWRNFIVQIGLNGIYIYIDNVLQSPTFEVGSNLVVDSLNTLNTARTLTNYRISPIFQTENSEFSYIFNILGDNNLLLDSSTNSRNADSILGTITPIASVSDGTITRLNVARCSQNSAIIADSYVGVFSNPSFTTFSISFWFKPSFPLGSLDVTNAYVIRFGSTSDVADVFSVYISQGGSSYTFGYYISVTIDNGSGSDSSYQLQTTSIGINDWRHTVITTQPGGCNIYINGVSQTLNTNTSNTLADAPNELSTYTTLRFIDTDNFSNCDFADLRVFNTILTPAQINKLSRTEDTVRYYLPANYQLDSYKVFDKELSLSERNNIYNIGLLQSVSIRPDTANDRLLIENATTTISNTLRYTGDTPIDGYILQTNAQGDLSYVENTESALQNQIEVSVPAQSVGIRPDTVNDRLLVQDTQTTISNTLRYTGDTPIDGYILQTNAQGDLSYVENSGNIQYTPTVITTTTTLTDASPNFIVLNPAATITLTLPNTPTPPNGLLFIILNVSTFTCTIDTGNSNVFDGIALETTTTLDQHDRTELLFYNNVWYTM